MRPQTDLPIPPKPAGEEPHLFGYGLRDRLLMTLAVNDRPLYITELTQMLGTWHSKVDPTFVPLEAAGIAISPFHTPSLRWVGLNTAFPAYLEGLRLFRRLEESWPQERVGKPRRRGERTALSRLRATPGRRATLPSSGRLEAAQTDRLFSSKPGSRALLAIAAMGKTDVVDLHQTVGLDRRSAWNVANRWQREGIIRSVRSARRRVIELDPAFPAAPELRQFMRTAGRWLPGLPSASPGAPPAGTTRASRGSEG